MPPQPLDADQVPYDVWRTSFCVVLSFLDARTDPHAGECCTKWLESEDEWIKAGAYDAQHFYNTIHGDPKKLELVKGIDWTAKYFYMKYITY